ncbi:MAG: lipoate protein ligase C-terminal domain-containing protein [Candidatus Hodarchaeota archaeon]
MEEWRLLDTGLRDAAENMALDRVILTSISEGKAPNTVRFLRFSKPCVLVGYHQDIDQEVRLDYCAQNEVDINRRLTGGGAIYFAPIHLGWEIISRRSQKFPRSMEKLTALICEGAVRALKRLGLNARFRSKNDIEIGGRKVSGTGGTSYGDAFLFQGTLLTDLDVREMLRCLRIPIKKLQDKEVQSLKERITTVKSEKGYLPDIETIKNAFKDEFSDYLGLSLKPGNLRPYEGQLLKEIIPYFNSEEWIYLVRVPKRGFFHASVKAPGGLIRAAVNVYENIINAAYLTGDFFVFPQNLIYEIESRVKQLPIKKKDIHEAVKDAFDLLDAEVPGVTPEDITKAVMDAASKVRLLDLGLSADEADQLIEVLVPAEYVLENARYLLLPYCAKPLECDLRYDPKCVKCGLCEFTTIYESAERLDFKPLTIVSYDHLERTLARLGRIGELAWIGSCCKQFYEKNAEGFDRSGIPGLLITTEGITCYDLGYEKAAYEGRYEGLSKVRSDLILKILNLSYDGKKKLPAPSIEI